MDDGCMDGWMEWMDGWMDGWMDVMSVHMCLVALVLILLL
jgi:hypothetical protein